jgi:hypothetical protein
MEIDVAIIDNVLSCKPMAVYNEMCGYERINNTVFQCVPSVKYGIMKAN